MATDFFISHASEDTPWATWIAWQLRAAGYSVTLDHWDFRAGQSFVSLMNTAAAECDRTIAVLSPTYLQSGFATSESNVAFAKDPNGKLGLLIPVRVERCELTGLLRQLIYIDLVGLDERAACEELVKKVHKEKVFPSTTPKFPGSKPTFPPSEPQKPDPPIPLSLQELAKRPLHSYHLTANSNGDWMWSYTVLRFERSDKPDVLRSRAIHTPMSNLSTERRTRYEFETEASFDHNNLVLHTHRSDHADDDIFVRMFPAPNRSDFPICGVGFLSHAWNQAPASTISLLNDVEFEYARGMADGDCISDPETMRVLQEEWERKAEDLHFLRLPRRATVHRSWDNLPKLFESITRDESDTTDLRILSIAFTDRGWPEDKITQLAEKKGVRTKIILMDPDAGEPMIIARNKIRYSYDRTTPKDVQGAINEQLRRLQNRREQINELKSRSKDFGGDIDFVLSDLFPYGFAAITRKFIVLGLFIAHGSYGIAPMMVFEVASNKPLYDSLKEDWELRWAQATKKRDVNDEVQSSTTSDFHELIVSDSKLITKIEARSPDESEIWVVAPDLSNVGDSTSEFSQLVRHTVSYNARRGINYLYVYPRGRAGSSRLELLQQCFVGASGKLRLCEVPPDRFEEFALVPTHFISFCPTTPEAKTYMQLPLAQSQKGWIQLSPRDQARILDKIKQQVEEYPISKAVAT